MVRFEWDPSKAQLNLKKHAVAFDDAICVFEDPYALLSQDRVNPSGEPRWQAIGMVSGLVVLLVAHTIRDQGEDEVIRLISARQATRKEKQFYEGNRAKDFEF